MDDSMHDIKMRSPALNRSGCPSDPRFVAVASGAKRPHAEMAPIGNNTCEGRASTRRGWSRRSRSQGQHVALLEEDGGGYDIRSFSPSGEVRFIEVKATRRDEHSVFFMSSNEIESARQPPRSIFSLSRSHFRSSIRNRLFLRSGAQHWRELRVGADALPGECACFTNCPAR
jgi:hypothetical protein